METKIEIINNVTTLKFKGETYYKIQDIAELYTADVRIHKVASNINLLTVKQVKEYKKKPYYKYNSADYIGKKDLIALIQQRVKKLEKRAESDVKLGQAPKKFDIQSAIWARDNLSVDINIQYITGHSNRSDNSVNRNSKNRIRNSSKKMPK